MDNIDPFYVHHFCHTFRWAKSILPASDGDGCLTMTRTSWTEECCVSSAGSERDRTVTHIVPLTLTLIVTLTPISDCYAPMMPVTLTFIVTLSRTLDP